MTYTCDYSARQVVEKATMGEPFRRAYPNTLDGDCKYWDDVAEYEFRKSKLKKYPASWLTPEMDGKEVVEGIDFFIMLNQKCVGITGDANLYEVVLPTTPIKKEGEPVTIEHAAEVIKFLNKENDKLKEFKAYVHQRLDEAGIEKEPNGEHSKHGCRIGDRLDIVLRVNDKINSSIPLPLPSQPSREAGGDLQAQIKEHIRTYTHFDWHEALSENEMGFLVDLLLTFRYSKFPPPLAENQEALWEEVEDIFLSNGYDNSRSSNSEANAARRKLTHQFSITRK